MTPVAKTDADLVAWGMTMKDNGYFSFSMMPGHSAEAGEELFLRYGKHSNRTLFVQYGFVDSSLEKEGEVDVADILEDIFRSKGDVGSWLMGVLEEEGYKK